MGKLSASQLHKTHSYTTQKTNVKTLNHTDLYKYYKSYGGPNISLIKKGHLEGQLSYSHNDWQATLTNKIQINELT